MNGKQRMARQSKQWLVDALVTGVQTCALPILMCDCILLPDAIQPIEQTLSNQQPDKVFLLPPKCEKVLHRGGKTNRGLIAGGRF